MEEAVNIGESYERAALVLRHGRSGVYWYARPLGGKRDAWDFMRFVAKHSARQPDEITAERYRDPLQGADK